MLRFPGKKFGSINATHDRFEFGIFGDVLGFEWIHVINLPVFSRVVLLPPGQSQDGHSASEVTLKDMGKIDNLNKAT